MKERKQVFLERERNTNSRKDNNYKDCVYEGPLLWAFFLFKIMKDSFIEIIGANTYNLKNVSLKIPINKISVFTGPSGSGKSSLAFHTIVVESRRRYMNSLPNDIKFFWQMPNSTDVEKIQPVLPVWSLAQSNPVIGARSSIADTIGLTEDLQKLAYFDSVALCDFDKERLIQSSCISDFVEEIKSLSGIVHVLIPRSHYLSRFGLGATSPRSLRAIDSKDLNDFCADDQYWEVLRVKSEWARERIANKLTEMEDILGNALLFNNGISHFFNYTKKMVCSKCRHEYPFIEKSLDNFSPYNARGACNKCNGHGSVLLYSIEKFIKNDQLSIEEGALHPLEGSRFGYLKKRFIRECNKNAIDTKKPYSKVRNKKIDEMIQHGFSTWPGMNSLLKELEVKRYKRSVRIYLRSMQKEEICTDCNGTRLSHFTNQFYIESDKYFYNYNELFLKNIDELVDIFSEYIKYCNAKFQYLAKRIFTKLIKAKELGLGYIRLDKKTKDLTSSEYQRSLLVKIINYEGSGCLFVLDEPSVGLSDCEQTALIECLRQLRDQDNTVILVEHNEKIIKSCDLEIKIGPGTGNNGGEIVDISKPKKYIIRNEKNNIKAKEVLTLPKLKESNLSSLKIALNEVTILNGNNMALKEKLILKSLASTVQFVNTNEYINEKEDVKHAWIKLLENKFENLLVSKSAINKKSGRSTVGTFLGFSSIVRDYYSNLPVSKTFNLSSGHFSVNSDLGKCSSCNGTGIKEIEMSFLEDVQIVCEDCNGKKLKPFISNISDGEQVVFDAFNLPMEHVLNRIRLTPKFRRTFEFVKMLNLEYLSLERSLSSLSGGERQRINLISAVQKNYKNSLMIFENISAGLSKSDLVKVMDVIDSLIGNSNTIVLLDQNKDLLSRYYSNPL